MEISLSISFNLAENISLPFVWCWKIGDFGLGCKVDPDILGIEYSFTSPVNPSFPAWYFEFEKDFALNSSLISSHSKSGYTTVNGAGATSSTGGLTTTVPNGWVLRKNLFS